MRYRARRGWIQRSRAAFISADYCRGAVAFGKKSRKRIRWLPQGVFWMVVWRWFSRWHPSCSEAAQSWAQGPFKARSV